MTKLIKSSLYKVNGQVARYVGVSGPICIAQVYAFSAHGTSITATHSGIEVASKAEINAYLGK